jgi:hypothetical protein
MDPAKVELVNRIMSEFWAVFNQNWAGVTSNAHLAQPQRHFWRQMLDPERHLNVHHREPGPRNIPLREGISHHPTTMAVQENSNANVLLDLRPSTQTRN